MVTGDNGTARGIVPEVSSAPVLWDRLARERNTFAGYYAAMFPGARAGPLCSQLTRLGAGREVAGKEGPDEVGPFLFPRTPYRERMGRRMGPMAHLLRD